jgi:hypothetical protein
MFISSSKLPFRKAVSTSMDQALRLSLWIVNSISITLESAMTGVIVHDAHSWDLGVAQSYQSSLESPILLFWLVLVQSDELGPQFLFHLSRVATSFSRSF